MKRKVKIELMVDRVTGRKALQFADADGGGYRITKGKDTGCWKLLETFECEFTDEQLNEYCHE